VDAFSSVDNLHPIRISPHRKITVLDLVLNSILSECVSYKTNVLNIALRALLDAVYDFRFRMADTRNRFCSSVNGCLSVARSGWADEWCAKRREILDMMDGRWKREVSEVWEMLHCANQSLTIMPKHESRVQE